MRPDLSRPPDPAELSLIGLTPLLTVCTSLLSGLTMGLVWLVALCLSSVTVSCLRRIIPRRLSLIYILLISAAWVSILDLLMQACCYALRQQLDIYLFLLAMNTALLLQLDSSLLHKTFGESIPASVRMALMGAVLLTLSGLLRELAGRGGLLTDTQLLAHVEWSGFSEAIWFFKGGLHLFNTSAGAFIIYGVLLAVLLYCCPRVAGHAVPDS